ncbi:hypothetical protein QQ020_07865 [Fulvivirgaceae bacterium BMA12]|uniref:Uncharacterized protein n=1 Tax=Agaribacillus aureus TaxID=3051825 RepID=A0ABT8L2N1_9BACT|nr:hypothetical protein [Fulvivirgaceae bacterium BMA12]
MKRKPVIILSGCLIFTTVLVAMLYGLSDKGRHERNSFVRNYQPDIATKLNELDIRYNSYFIAGMVDNQIYLGNVTAPAHLLIANTTLTDTQHVKLHIKNRENFKLTKLLIVKVDSPYFYLVDGLMPGFFRGKIGEWKAEHFMPETKAYFNQCIPFGDSAFAIRTKSLANKEYELGVVTNDSPHVKLEHGLLEKQIKGTFCVDGELNYSKALDRLVYTYRYRNEYIVFEPNLQLDYRGHTIDTFSRAQINIAKINSENARTLTSRPKIINAQSRVSGNYLYVHSGLLAKNDQLDALYRSSIIDVYDLRNNTYKFSIQIPNHHQKKLTKFQVFNDEMLVATHDRYLVTYDLKPGYL